MHLYYLIDSNGENTNLQLYSLKQAKLYWLALERDLLNGEEVAHFHERCVFVICTLGLSVSQLLGQNNPVLSKRIPNPAEIFTSLVERHGLDPGLIIEFKEFIDTYDHCRHFGLTSDGGRHGQVSQVTLEKTKRLYNFGLFVWDIVVDAFRRDPENSFEDLDLTKIEIDR